MAKAGKAGAAGRAGLPGVNPDHEAGEVLHYTPAMIKAYNDELKARDSKDESSGDDSETN